MPCAPCSPGGKEPGTKKWPKGAARLRLGEHLHGCGEDQEAGRESSRGEEGMAGAPERGSYRASLEGKGQAGAGKPSAAPSSQKCPGALRPLHVVRAVCLQGCPWPTAHRSCSRSWVSFSRAFRCRMHTSFCCRGVRYCSGVGGLTPWLSLHSMYFMERLQGDTCQRRGGRMPSLSWSHGHQIAPG